MNKVDEEVKPTGDGARSERQDWRTLRKLDAQIAERVMGWTNVEADCYTPIGKEWCGDDPEGTGGFNRTGRKIVRRYSTDMAAAMEVVARLCPTMEEYNTGRKSCRFILRQQDSGAWSVEARSPFLTSYDTPAFADSKSLPEAICRAALSLVDVNSTDEEVK